ncbi:MAG TPA: DUF4114 domain-containing protein, partial [Polyangiaceae bacterium]|nr:DUF4114 domain-containing protein [Polyangiaceae bacterium]
ACTPMDPFITTVVYKGTVEDNSYYMAFEDLPVDPTSFLANNDGDFNDFVFYITGLVCAGGGAPCDTGLQGACAVGKTDCSENGMPGACRQVVKPNTEACDNVDNDCNGMVDDGDGLCPKGKVCDHGSCVAACNTGEFRCPNDLTCDNGFCIDPLCKNHPCDMGQACRAGKCVGVCDGVTCPTGQECQLGRCVDLCAGVTCLEKQVCEGGLCLSTCGCRTCGPGKACGDSGQCVATGCEKVTCQPGQVCVAGGMCKDACEGAVCPGGAVCMTGQCQAPMVMPDVPGAGGDNGVGGQITLGPLGGSLSVGGSASVAGSAGGGSKSVIPVDNSAAPILKSGETATGCNCRAAGTPASSRLLWLAAAALGVAALSRRRRR